MKKKAYLVTIVGGWLLFPVQAFKSNVETMDAVSRATYHSSCVITLPITVTTYSATLAWWEDHPDQGSASISYGPDTAHLTTRDVTAEERTNQKLTLTGLTGDKNYFIRLLAIKTEERPYADTATIKTMNPAGTLQRFAISKNIPLELLDHSVRLGSQAIPGDRLTLTDCSGRTLLSRFVSGKESMIRLPSIAEGVYVLTYQRQGKVLDKKRMVKGN